MQENNTLFLLKEYEKLKDEQSARLLIASRTTYLSVFLTLLAFCVALSEYQYRIVLLVLPFTGLALGWNYVSNHQKINAIGKYMRTSLLPRIAQTTFGEDTGKASTWEDFIMNEPTKISRALIQFFIDSCVYCFPGAIAIIAFLFNHSVPNHYIVIAATSQFILLVLLFFQFIKYVDVSKGGR